MEYREHIRGACQELAAELSGMKLDSSESEVDLWLSDLGLTIDFNQIAHRTTQELPPAPGANEPRLTLYQDETPSYFPCFSPYAAYLDHYNSQLITEKAVSFVNSTGTDSTDKTYLRDRRYELKSEGIEPENQILILLPGRIPENLTQKLAVYYLVARGWMVAEDSWYTPRLHTNGVRHHPGYGVPDIVAWRSEFTSKLAERGWIRDGGAVHELSLLSVRESLHGKGTTNKDKEEQTIVGEVKKSDTSFGSAVKQLYERNNSNPGYLKSGCFDEGYGVVALERERNRNGAGTITFDEDGFYIAKDAIEMDYQGEPIETATRATPNNKQDVIEQLDRFAAQMLLCNVTMGTIRELLHIDGANPPHQFFAEIDYLSNDEILQACADEIQQA
ncbi:hypothetical protein [Halobacterium hubeiense]|uniref:hypothetical protein n=2 Tax=Halobacterium hubeiense TaxID=1407499 RepID=UPI00117A1431|nr:hypothetical protein [Halobacterium hubeiense]